MANATISLTENWQSIPVGTSGTIGIQNIDARFPIFFVIGAALPAASVIGFVLKPGETDTPNGIAAGETLWARAAVIVGSGNTSNIEVWS